MKRGKMSAMNRSSLKDEYAKISYSVGYQVGGDFKRQKLTIHPELFLKGIQDAIENNELLMNKAEIQKILVDMKKKIVVSEQEEKKKAAEKNLEKGEAFLMKNEKKRGIKTLESGLQYRILKKGSGAVPKATDMVTLHYKGNLIDGKEFDSSYKRGEPATFRADSCIRGWTEALQMMEEGAKWKLFVPSDLAYGERGAGVISPNSTLVFNLELISVRSSKQR
jgi:FKBP-type peptidyl-prolyl cis-trans isomerase FklB